MVEVHVCDSAGRGGSTEANCKFRTNMSAVVCVGLYGVACNCFHRLTTGRFDLLEAGSPTCMSLLATTVTHVHKTQQ